MKMKIVWTMAAPNIITVPINSVGVLNVARWRGRACPLDRLLGSCVAWVCLIYSFVFVSLVDFCSLFLLLFAVSYYKYLEGLNPSNPLPRHSFSQPRKKHGPQINRAPPWGTRPAPPPATAAATTLLVCRAWT